MRCLCVYVVVDDLWRQIAPQFRRPEPEPLCSDSELIATVLSAECRGWELETDGLAQWREHRDLFPHIPSQSRFNRRRRGLFQASCFRPFVSGLLFQAFELIRRSLLGMLDLAQDRPCALATRIHCKSNGAFPN